MSTTEGLRLTSAQGVDSELSLRTLSDAELTQHIKSKMWEPIVQGNSNHL